jgi:16S rRNA (guanine966-N2)-methyltransferase
MPKHKTMRITGGTFVRQRFLVPPMVDDGSVRPTPDRVREAIFSMILADVKDAMVLDLFAGSGAHGFEALSRGARFVHFVEKNPAVAAVIKENISHLGLDGMCRVEVYDALALKKIVLPEPAQIVFVDPPYSLSLGAEFFQGLLPLLAAEALVIFRCFKKNMPPIDDNFTILRDRIYGGTRVFVLQRV